MNSDALAYLAARGFTVEEIVEFARLSERRKDATNAERQARHRAKRKAEKVTRYSNGVTPPIEELHTPCSGISPDGENQNDTARGKPNPFPRPEWCPPPLWDDWLEVRKAKRSRNTATAYAAFLADIEKLTNDEWPPGRLLRYAVAQSWAGIYEPKEGYPSGRHPPRTSIQQTSRGSNPDPLIDMLAAARAARAAEDSADDPGDDHGTWAALPAIGTG